MSNRSKPIPADAKKVFEGVIFEVYQWEQEMFDGSIQTFERLKRPNTAQVIAVAGDKVLTLIEEQPNSKKPCPSIPGGRCDEGETPLESAQRELLEETGYVSEDWQLWKEEDPVGKMEWTIYTFVARNCLKQQEPHLDAGERIELKPVSFDEFLALSDDPLFYSPDLIPDMLRARLDPIRTEALRAMLFQA